MSDENNEVLDNFLEHFGVKGMKWGKRKFTIQEARSKSSGLARDVKRAEGSWRAQKTEEGKNAALKNLKEKEKIDWENRQVANTLTRGEQVAVGVLASIATTPIGGLALVAGASALTRDSKKFSSKYPD